MSYILEALKKAQAERQVGELPTIHAPTLHGGHDGATALAWRTPLLIALVVAGLMAAGNLLWKSATPATSPVPASAMPAPEPQGAAAVPVATPLQALPSVPAQALPVQSAAPAPLPVMQPAPVVAPAPPAAQAPRTTRQMADAATAPGDDGVLLVRDLPEPIQRQIPGVSMGGYMYSKNPADRLVLIDKVLRHEGEEIAPGIVLEKLQAKSAIFTFKGYRYRVPY